MFDDFLRGIELVRQGHKAENVTYGRPRGKESPRYSFEVNGEHFSLNIYGFDIEEAPLKAFFDTFGTKNK